MRILLLMLFTLIISSSCNQLRPREILEFEEKKTSNKSFLMYLKSKEKIVFRDSSKMGAGTDGSLVELTFFPDSKLILNTYGNGFSTHHGKYKLISSDKLEIKIENQQWPLLILNKDNGYLLNRQDGLRSLKNHVEIHTDKGELFLVNDGDIYPFAEDYIFPLFELQ